MIPQRPFTLAELRRYDGHRGRSFVAHGGSVYDVSASAEWRGGLHRNLHWAGQDLTSYLDEAPHGVENLARYPVVGWLVEEAKT
jgi:predicted heme/steroid binding protein